MFQPENLPENLSKIVALLTLPFSSDIMGKNGEKAERNYNET